MNKHERLLLSAVMYLLISAGCNSNNQNQSGNDNDSLYTGPRFNENIRSTEALTPEQERASFKLPEGFEVNLYASEPDIGKPINFNFDAQGRMWVAQSFEYPFPATPGTGKDRVTILEDTDHDGKADKFTQFNDTLNIPIGVMPLNDGAIVYSIPNVYKYTDADGDGKPETQKKFFGPFEVRDTHGMVNNFLLGYDGWIHGCHGYTNRSTVAGSDGDSVHFVSGNTYRFRRDGSRIEMETSGRINPFGLTYDEWGYLYSTDCHTSPLYQLIRGGDYTQWGKEEGMGFAPDMQSFTNEATALAGISYYGDTKFPEAYRSNLYVGDAVSSKVYRYSFTWDGSSPIGKREKDFILSADPWFRPVNIKLGPDGALYVADFYNAIIGHYEVPLDHPKRDHVRGRIWRITYKGDSHKTMDLSKAPVEELLKALNTDNLPVRIVATDQLVTRIGQAAIAPVKALINKKDVSTREYIHCLWVLQRLGALDNDLIQRSAASPDPVIRTHTMRVMAEQKDTSAELYPLVVRSLEDESPHVRRAAVELMGRYVNMNSVESLIAFRKKVPADDSHMIYTIRLTLRNLLRHEPLMNQVASRQWTDDDAAVLSTVMVGVETPASGVFLFDYVKKANNIDQSELPKAFMHVVRFVPASQVNQVIAMGMDKSKNNSNLEFKVFKSLKEGLARRGSKETAQFRDWGKNIIMHVSDKNLKAPKTAEDEDVLEIKFAIDLAGEYKVTAVEPKLIDVFTDTGTSSYLRTYALNALMKMDPVKNAALAGKLLQDPETIPEFKRNIVSILGEFPGASVNKALAAITNPSPDLQQGIVMALAGTSDGRNLLFEKVKKGEIFPRALAEPKVEDRLLMNISPAQKAVYKQLTANLDVIDKEKQSVIHGRIADYKNLQQKPPAEEGHAVFVKNCAPCHSVNGSGGSIGPNLDGVGKWGVAPLAEKILDPNRNVSENFRMYILKLKDGKVLSGLYRRDEGQVIVFADAAGQEFSVSKQEIVERKPSKYTLMPDQFRNTISQHDFNALLSFLLSRKG